MNLLAIQGVLLGILDLKLDFVEIELFPDVEGYLCLEQEIWAQTGAQVEQVLLALGQGTQERLAAEQELLVPERGKPAAEQDQPVAELELLVAEQGKPPVDQEQPSAEQGQPVAEQEQTAAEQQKVVAVFEHSVKAAVGAE